MNFFELLTLRHSTRKFSKKPVEKSLIEKIIMAANAAPVGSNLYKDLHLTVVENREILLKLGDAARYRRKDKDTLLEITKNITDKDAAPNNFDPFYGAPAVIFVSHRKQSLQPGIEYSNVASIINSMHLAATELGLGSVYMWGSLEAMRIYPEFDNTHLLELPDNFEPLLGLAIGYPANSIAPRTLTADKISINYI